MPERTTEMEVDQLLEQAELAEKAARIARENEDGPNAEKLEAKARGLRARAERVEKRDAQ